MVRLGDFDIDFVSQKTFKVGTLIFKTCPCLVLFCFRGIFHCLLSVFKVNYEEEDPLCGTVL